MFSIKNAALSILAATTLFAGPAMAADWTIDPAHSSISFAIDHMVISEVEGSFGQFAGTIKGYDGADASKTQVDVTIQVSSIDTNNAKRDEHLRSPDFFDAAKYPTAVFKSKAVKKTGEKSFDVVGDFTLHGVTKEITIPMTHRGTVVDPWGNTKAGFQGTITLDRTQFGLLESGTLETGGLIIGTDVRLTFRVEASQDKAAEAKPAEAKPAKPAKK